MSCSKTLGALLPHHLLARYLERGVIEAKIEARFSELWSDRAWDRLSARLRFRAPGMFL